jgi:hypothetical protein
MASPSKFLAGHKKESKGKKKPSKGKKHKIREIRIKPTDNDGFTADHSFHPEEGDDGQMQSPPDQTHAFGDANSLMAHLGDTLGASAPGAAGPGAGPGAGMGGQ